MNNEIQNIINREIEEIKRKIEFYEIVKKELRAALISTQAFKNVVYFYSGYEGSHTEYCDDVKYIFVFDTQPPFEKEIRVYHMTHSVSDEYRKFIEYAKENSIAEYNMGHDHYDMYP